MPVIQDQWQMVRTRITPTHKLLGVQGSLPSTEVLSQRQIPLDRVSKVRQHNSYRLHNKGGTRSPQLLTLALEMWDWCQAKDIFVIATHVPGRHNISADMESRIFKDMSEWKLNPTIIQPFLQNCQTNLFASRLTTQWKNYISWKPDPVSTLTIYLFNFFSSL